jgi:hypothetical protein
MELIPSEGSKCDYREWQMSVEFTVHHSCLSRTGTSKIVLGVIDGESSFDMYVDMLEYVHREWHCLSVAHLPCLL